MKKKKRIFNWWSGRVINVYLTVPEITPIFGTTTTINPTDTDIQTADLGGNTDIIMGAGIHLPRLKFNTLIGTVGTPIRFSGVLGGSADARDFLTTLGDDSINDYAAWVQGCDWVEFHNLNINGGTGFHAGGGSKNVVFSNCKVRDSGFAGFLIKTDGDNTIPPSKVVVQFCTSRHGLGEGRYNGQVNLPTYHTFSEVESHDNDWCVNGREPSQDSHVLALTITHDTGLGCGTTNEGGQNRPLQIQDCAGIVKHSAFGSVGTFGSVYLNFHNADGIEYFNCYFEGQNEFYIGNQAAKDWYATSIVKGNDDVVLDNLILNASVGYEHSGNNYAARHLGDVQDVRMRNCIIPDNLSHHLRDESGATYESIEEYNNIILPASHAAFNIRYDSKGRITSAFHFKRGMGAFLPDPTIPSYSSRVLSGTETEQFTLTATFGGFDSGSDNNGVVLTARPPAYQWQRDTDGTGTTYDDIVGENSSTYKLTYLDVGKLIRCRGQAINEVYLAGALQYTNATGAIVKNFVAFNSIPWENSYDLDAADIATDEFVLNQGSSTNAVKTTGVSLPTHDATYNGLNFDRATGQNLSFPIAAKSTDWELWLNFKMTTLASNHRIVGYGGSHYVRVTAAGGLYFGATNTGIILTAGTDYVIRFKIQGATSSITINNGTPTVLTLTTNAVSGTGRIGSDNIDGNFYDGKAKAFFDKVTELTAQNVSDMWTYYGL